MRGWLAAVAAGLVGAGAPVAAMAGATQITLPVSTSFSLCNGDAVNVTGTIHGQLNDVTSSDGTTHFSISENFRDVQGVDTTTGATYHVTGGASVVENVSVNTTGTIHLVEHVTFVGTGSAPDFAVVVREHMTVNANGTVTANISYSSDC